MVPASQAWRSGQLHLGVQVRQAAGLALRVAALLLRMEEVAQGVLLRGVWGLENAWRWGPGHRLRTLHLSRDPNSASQACPSSHSLPLAARLIMELFRLGKTPKITKHNR